ncbi:MAG: hypothetical protein DRR42_06945 [Gammaproteobacteria bacterium]|nr:MAG: hypothetical protein DRR42_06945 [Gammaproteobacteria bacterium]
MRAKYSVEELLPHSGRMSLLGSIVGHGEDWLQAEVYITAASMFVDDRGVPAWVGLEFLAQGVAAFAGIKERQNGGKPKLGFLLGSRRYLCSTDYFLVGETLSIKVQEEVSADNGLCVFQGTLWGENVEASANLNVYQPDDAEKFMKGSGL